MRNDNNEYVIIMLKISRLADYATAILDVLCRLPAGQGMSASVIAELTGLTQATSSKILKQLNDAEIVKSERGTNGGYMLAKSAELISLAAIISAIDGKPAITQCSNDDADCCQDINCTVRGNWQLINFLMTDLLANINLTQMTKTLAVASYARVSTKNKEPQHG